MKFNVNYHASICVNDDIYIDPLKIKDEVHNAKVVLVTHPHWDHLSIEDIKKVANEKTFFIAPQDCIESLRKEGFKLEDQKNCWIVAGKSFSKVYGDYENCGGTLGYQIPNTNAWVLAFPSYNLNKQNHTKDKLWVGYILTVDGVRYVICGDSDFTPELARIKCDVLFIPIGGTYTMNAMEAAECSNTVKPKVVAPVHYLTVLKDGKMLGSKADEKIFVDNLDKDIQCKLFF